jgi:hypothetical protein
VSSGLAWLLLVVGNAVPSWTHDYVHVAKEAFKWGPWVVCCKGPLGSVCTNRKCPHRRTCQAGAPSEHAAALLLSLVVHAPPPPTHTFSTFSVC